MKRLLISLFLIIILLSGCAPEESAQIAATTLPVYEFTARLCEGTDLSVTRLVTESVSCLHDYSLNVNQVKSAEAAELIVLSGAGLEEFLEDILHDKASVDASQGIQLICPEEADDHDHEHDHDHDHEGHHHENDPHIWLSPVNAAIMAQNICTGLSEHYPQYAETFAANLDTLVSELAALQTYGEQTLASLSCRDMITFHDGFGYFAQAFDLHILEAVEEESGSEASARELIHLIQLVEEHDLPAVFTEVNGSVSAAEVIARETGAQSFALDMAMGGDSYFDAIYHNITMIKEAMG